MSGDYGLCIAVPASLQALQDDPHIHLHLVGDAGSLGQALVRYRDADLSRIDVVPARVVLLSNGTESNKDNAVIRAAGEKLGNDKRINFCGFMEGSAVCRA